MPPAALSAEPRRRWGVCACGLGLGGFLLFLLLPFAPPPSFLFFSFFLFLFFFPNLKGKKTLPRFSDGLEKLIIICENMKSTGS